MRNDKKDKTEKKIPQAKIIKLQNTTPTVSLDHLLKDLEKINSKLEAHWEQENKEDDFLDNPNDSTQSYDPD